MHALAQDEQRGGDVTSVRQFVGGDGHAMGSRGEPLEQCLDGVPLEARARQAEARKGLKEGVGNREIAPIDSLDAQSRQGCKPAR